MKVLTAEQMREVDRLTIERGVPSLALMENAAHRVMETLEVEFDPIAEQRIVILCGRRLARRPQGRCAAYAEGWLRLLSNHSVIGSHCFQSGQARYSGSSSTPMPRA